VKAKPKHLIPSTSLKSVNNNKTVNRVNEFVEAQYKGKKRKISTSDKNKAA